MREFIDDESEDDVSYRPGDTSAPESPAGDGESKGEGKKNKGKHRQEGTEDLDNDDAGPAPRKKRKGGKNSGSVKAEEPQEGPIVLVPDVAGVPPQIRAPTARIPHPEDPLRVSTFRDLVNTPG